MKITENKTGGGEVVRLCEEEREGEVVEEVAGVLNALRHHVWGAKKQR